LLKVEGLNVRYGPIAALRNVSLQVNRGELVSVIGANGAGKTTLLVAIAGGIQPAAGSILFDGRPITGLRPEAVVRLGISLVPEGRRIFASLTVEENLRLAQISTRRAEVGAYGNTDAVFELFPILKEYLHKPSGQLSGGEQQQLAIARALLTNPLLLLIDEPSLGLAPFLVDRVFDVLSELRRQGVTILLIEQNAVRAMGIADRLYVLRTGVIEPVEKSSRITEAIASGSLYFGDAAD
jgi:branched-chain amino acid transport system ATP-binding protein